MFTDDILNSLPACFKSNIVCLIDCICWGSSPNASYSAKSGYRWFRERQEVASNLNLEWSLIWQIHVPEKSKFLVWLIQYDRLLANEFHFLRHITGSCPSCNMHVEFVDHLLKNYEFAKTLWKHAFKSLFPPNFWAFLSIWRIHNLLIFENDQLSDYDQFHLVDHVISEWHSDVLVGINPIVNNFHHHVVIVAGIIEMKKWNWVLKFEHIMREGNQVANILAKLGCHSKSSLCVLLSPPIETILTLDVDASSTCFERG
ncbi:hypothetical protein ACFE04_022929 [Oxalis oulophora]